MMRRQLIFIMALALVAGAGLSADSRKNNGKLEPKSTANSGPESQNRPARFGLRGPDKADTQDRPRMLSAEEIEQLLTFTQQHFPEVYAKLIRARQEDARAFRPMLRRLSQPMLRLMKLAEENPAEAEQLIAIQKLEIIIHERKRRYVSATSEQERAPLRAEMRELIEQKFELRQAKLKRETADLQRRVDEQARRMADQSGRKEQLVDEELNRVLEGNPKDTRVQGGGPASKPASLPRINDAN